MKKFLCLLVLANCVPLVGMESAFSRMRIEETVTLISKDGQEFKIERAIAEKSELIKGWLELNATPIFNLDVDANILKKIIDLLEAGPITNNLSARDVIAIARAADYLQIKPDAFDKQAVNLITFLHNVKNDEGIILQSQDGQEFAVPRKRAELSETIKSLLEEESIDEIIIPLPNITGKTLSSIVEFMIRGWLNWDMPASDLADITVAASYLDIKKLFDYAIGQCARLPIFRTDLEKLKSEESYKEYKRSFLDKFPKDLQQLILAKNEEDLLSIRTIKHLAAFQPEMPKQVKALSFSPDGTRLAAVLEDDTVKIWNIEQLNSPRLIETRTVKQRATVRSGKVTLADGWIIEVPYITQFTDAKTPYGMINCLVVNPVDNSIVATGSENNPGWSDLLNPIGAVARTIVGFIHDERPPAQTVNIWQRPDLKKLDLASAQIIVYIVKNKIQNLADLPKHLRDNLNSYGTSLLFSWYQRGLNWAKDKWQ